MKKRTCCADDMKNKKIFHGWIPKTWLMYANFKKSPLQWEQCKKIKILSIPNITKTKPIFIDGRSKRRVKVKVTIEEVL